MNSSKLSAPRSFSISIIWYMFTGWLLTFTKLFQNHVEWFFPAFFNCLYLYANWWFSWHMLSEMKSLPVNFSRLRFSELLLNCFFAVVKNYCKQRNNKNNEFKHQYFSVGQVLCPMCSVFGLKIYLTRFYVNIKK